MLCRTSGLSSAMVSPTATNRSTAQHTAAPTLCTAAPLAAASPRVDTSVLIYKNTRVSIHPNKKILKIKRNIDKFPSLSVSCRGSMYNRLVLFPCVSLHLRYAMKVYCSVFTSKYYFLENRCPQTTNSF